MNDLDKDILSEFLENYKKLTKGRSLKDDLNNLRGKIADPNHWLLVVQLYFNMTYEDMFIRNKGMQCSAKSWYYYLCTINGVPYLKTAKLIGRSHSIAYSSFESFAPKVRKSKDLTDIKVKLLNYPVPGVPTNVHSYIDPRDLFKKYSVLISEFFNISIEDLESSKGIKDKSSSARIWLYYLLHKEGISSVRIAKMMNRTHGTILTTVKNLKGKLETDDDTKIMYMRIRYHLKIK